MVEFTQELVNEYIQNWIGVSAIARENNTPGFFRLYFPNQQSAFKSFVFIDGWQEWLPEHKMVLSIVKENEKEYTFYIYKETRTEFIKSTFSSEINLNIENLESFMASEKNGKFVILTSYPNENNDIVDGVSQKIVVFEKLKFANRSEIKSYEIESV
ncbi:hypothetical protein ACFS5J_04135 [Flavobacterium chuncheonense]|uniref:Uncharacterized protein n=1 Tax=Flavobacterium chuncheonense TaxID=2026653 RepID=A0ABW5YJJ0_9FLAO